MTSSEFYKDRRNETERERRLGFIIIQDESQKSNVALGKEATAPIKSFYVGTTHR